MKKIILDTNFLLIPYQFHVDIFSEIERIMQTPYQLCIVDKTIDELHNICVSERDKYKKGASIALELIDKKGIHILKTEKNKNVDDLILNLVKRDEYIVATQDMPLKRKLRLKYIQIIDLRQKKYLKLH